MRRLLRLFAKLELIISQVSLISGRIASYCVLFVVVLISVEVILRKIFSLTTYISVEFSGYSLVAIIFLGLATTLLAERHLRIEVLINQLSKRKRFFMIGSTSIIAFGYVMVLLFCFAIYLFRTYELGAVSLATLEIPLYIPRSLMVIGTAIFALQLIPYIIRIFKPMPTVSRSEKAPLNGKSSRRTEQ